MLTLKVNIFENQYINKKFYRNMFLKLPVYLKIKIIVPKIYPQHMNTNIIEISLEIELSHLLFSHACKRTLNVTKASNMCIVICYG